jgi:hypothetical protein
VWNTSNQEDKRRVAHSLFEYVVYNLDTRRIVDFRLKLWADQFFVLRAALYEDNEEENPIKGSILIRPMGDSNSRFRRERATS